MTGPKIAICTRFSVFKLILSIFILSFGILDKLSFAKTSKKTGLRPGWNGRILLVEPVGIEKFGRKLNACSVRILGYPWLVF